MTIPFQKDCLIAVEQAMAVCRQVQQNLVSEQTLVKKDRSPVTVADYASQIILTRALKRMDPSARITAEEDSADLAAPEQAALKLQVLEFCQSVHPDMTDAEMLDLLASGNHPGGADGAFWTIDPIDGTKGFLRGDQYAVALARIENGIVQFGILGCPNLTIPSVDASHQGYLLSASSGQGAEARAEATTLPTSLQVDPTTDPSQWRFCEPFESGHSSHDDSAKLSKRLNIQQVPIRMDSQAKYATCAAGITHAYLRLPTRPGYEEKIWDHAAGVILIEEAGGRVTDVDGKPLDFAQGHTLSKNSGVIASSGVFHDTLIESLSSM